MKCAFCRADNDGVTKVKVGAEYIPLCKNCGFGFRYGHPGPPTILKPLPSPAVVESGGTTSDPFDTEN
jgi:hypothetical protein